MKKYFCIVVLLFAQQINTGGYRKIFSSGGSTPTRVGTPTCNSSGGAAVTVTYSPTAGNTMAVGVAYAGTTEHSTTVKDSAGVSFTQQGTTEVGAARASEAWSLLSEGAGITSITVTPSNTTLSMVVCVQEYSHVTAVGNPNQNTYASGTSYSLSITQANANDQVFLSVAAAPSSSAFTATNGTILASLLKTAGIYGVIQGNSCVSSGACTVSATYTSASAGAMSGFDLQ